MQDSYEPKSSLIDMVLWGPISLVAIIQHQLNTLYQPSGCSISIVTHINVLTDWEPCYNYCDIKSSMCLVIIISPVHSTKFLVTAYPLRHVQVPESIMILTNRKICVNCYGMKSHMCLAILKDHNYTHAFFSFTHISRTPIYPGPYLLDSHFSSAY